MLGRTFRVFMPGKRPGKRCCCAASNYGLTRQEASFRFTVNDPPFSDKAGRADYDYQISRKGLSKQGYECVKKETDELLTSVPVRPIEQEPNNEGLWGMLQGTTKSKVSAIS
ncbi:MAG: hypothetical protein JW697_08965 [Kosmotogaceae bacterium]|nr:hypothetical protein [Kosmotogaceae bacterium]